MLRRTADARDPVLFLDDVDDRAYLASLMQTGDLTVEARGAAADGACREREVAVDQPYGPLQREVKRLGMEDKLTQVIIPTETVFEMRAGKKKTR